MKFHFFAQLCVKAFNELNDSLEDAAPYQIILGTALICCLVNQIPFSSIYRAYRTRHTKPLKQRLLDLGYSLGEYLPGLNDYVKRELDKNFESVKKKVEEERQHMTLRRVMPKVGLSSLEILKEFEIDVRECLYPFDKIHVDHPDKDFIIKNGEGKDSGMLYASHPKELSELLKEVYAKTSLSNPLHDKWKRTLAMNAEVISWCQELFHGSDEGYGLITHGGSTSIIEAMAAYVIHARSRGIKNPEIVVPETAHAAFKKAADLTGATLVVVPVNKETGAVDPDVMVSYISSNTAVIVGSAPSFMYGVSDPIEELGALAEKHKVPFHVDACLGGFFTCFQDTSDNPMDFRVEGVTSISADLHKYGCCPKGTSVCLFSKNSPVLPIYAALDWCGGLYTTPGILDGSTSGARIAEIYTCLAYYGREKYQDICKNILKLRLKIECNLQHYLLINRFTLEDLYIYGDSRLSVLGFQSKTLNIHLIAEEMDKRGWKLNLLQKPDGFHICLTHVHTLVENFSDKFLNDLILSVKAVQNYPDDVKVSGNLKVYGVVGNLPSQIMVKICELYNRFRLWLPSETVASNTKEEESEEELLILIE